MITNLALLSGGLATRLHPISLATPKALIDINGKLFIEHQLTMLKGQGITDIVICVGHMGDKIENFIGNGEKIGINVKYSYDGEKLLGTAGAIRKALPLLPETFFVMYGDSYPVTDFLKVSLFFESNNKQALMTIVENNDNLYRNNVIFEDGRIIKYDKKNITTEMRFIDYGLGIMNKECFNGMRKDEIFDLADIQKDLSDKGELIGYVIKEKTHEIGSFVGIEKFKKYESSQSHHRNQV